MSASSTSGGAVSAAYDQNLSTAWYSSPPPLVCADACCASEWIELRLPQPMTLGGLALRSVGYWDESGWFLQQGFVVLQNDAGQPLRYETFGAERNAGDWGAVFTPPVSSVSTVRVLPGRSVGPPQLAEFELFAPRNDRCADAWPLTFDANGRAGVTGDFVATGPDVVTCGTGTGNDLAYQFTLTATSDVRVEVSAVPGSATQPIVALVPKASCAAVTTARCARPTLALSALTAGALPAGTYVIWVDAAAGREGPFRLRVRATPTPTMSPVNDVCSTAPFWGGGQSGSAGSTSGAVAEMGAVSPDCGPVAPFVDVFHSVSTSSSTTTVVAVASEPGTSHSVSVIDACGGSTVLGCVNTADAGGVVSVELPPGLGTRLRVASPADAGGGYVVNVRSGAPQNDLCLGARPISVRTATSDSVAVDSLTGATNNFTGGALCPSSSAFPGPDLYYYFNPPSSGTYTVRLWPGPRLDASLAVLRGVGCFTVVGCDVGADGGLGAPEMVTFTSTSGVPAIIVVDALSGADGFLLTVE